MSDLIFTRSVDATTGWRRGDLVLDVLPVQEFRGGTFGLYFELYNARPGATYRIDIAIGEKSRGIFRERRSLRLSFDEPMPLGDAARVPILKAVQAELPPGTYVIRVTVADQETGAELVREREVRVGAGGEGRG